MKKENVKTLLIVLAVIAFLVLLIIIGASSSNNDESRGSSKYNNNSTNNTNNTTTNKPINRYSKLSDINFSDDKINIYFFWGNGCPHCEELFTFLENIQNEYGKYYNIYAFEVWYDQDNGKIMDYFLEKFDKKVGSRSVPFYIIGDELLEGYGSTMNEEIKNTIMDEYEDRNNGIDFKDVLSITF